MVKKMKKYVKFVVCMALIMGLIAPSYAALSASDGSAFVTKAEFDSALADFNARLTTFEAGINSKIDSQVTSYLDRNGIWNGKVQTLENNFDDLWLYDAPICSNANPDTAYKYVIKLPSEPNENISWTASGEGWMRGRNENYGMYWLNVQNDFISHGEYVAAFGTTTYEYAPVSSDELKYFNALDTKPSPKVLLIKNVNKTGLLVTTCEYCFEPFNNSTDASLTDTVSGLTEFSHKSKAERAKIPLGDIVYPDGGTTAFWDVFMLVTNAGQFSTKSNIGVKFSIYSSASADIDQSNEDNFDLSYSESPGSCEMGFSTRTKTTSGVHARGLVQIMFFVSKGSALWFNTQLTAYGRNAGGLCCSDYLQDTLPDQHMQRGFRFSNTQVY